MLYDCTRREYRNFFFHTKFCPLYLCVSRGAEKWTVSVIYLVNERGNICSTERNELILCKFYFVSILRNNTLDCVHVETSGTIL